MDLKKDLLSNYIHDEIDIFEYINLLDKLREKGEQISGGVVYTPKFIVDEIISTIDPSLEEFIVEPSSGHGVFIFGLLHFMQKKYQLSDIELKDWFESKILSIEIDPLKNKEQKEIIQLFFKKKNINNVSLHNIICEDSLRFNWDQLNIDIMIGNPPYIRSNNLKYEDLQYIKNNFVSCKKGNIDLYYAFIEIANKYSSRSGFIIPNTFIQNISAKKLRSEISYNVHSITDFKNLKIFNNASTYTAILILNNNPDENFLYRNKIDEPFIKKERELLLKEFWDFSSINNKNKTKISDIFSFYTGVATGKNYLYSIPNNNESLFEKVFENKLFKIEKNICRPLIKLTKPTEDNFIIFPYKNNKPMSIEEIYNKFPKSYQYLSYIKDILGQRDKGKASNYKEWYQYSRKQGINIPRYKYYIGLPTVFSDNFDYYLFDCSNKEDNELPLFISGYIIGISSLKDLKVLENIFKSNDFLTYMKNNSRMLSGKKAYYNYRISTLKDYRI